MDSLVWKRGGRGRESDRRCALGWPDAGELSRQREADGELQGERGMEERERADLGFSEIKTLNLKLAIYSKFFSIFADHNFSIRTPILAFFVSTNSV